MSSVRGDFDLQINYEKKNIEFIYKVRIIIMNNDKWKCFYAVSYSVGHYKMFQFQWVALFSFIFVWFFFVNVNHYYLLLHAPRYIYCYYFTIKIPFVIGITVRSLIVLLPTTDCSQRSIRKYIAQIIYYDFQTQNTQFNADFKMEWYTNTFDRQIWPNVRLKWEIVWTVDSFSFNAFWIF